MNSAIRGGRGAVVALAITLAAAGCGASEESERITLGDAAGDPASSFSPAVQAQMDSGNAAYRAREYEAALRHFQAAVELAPEEPTPWFGVGMAAGALGRTELQREANARVQQLAPQAETGLHGAPGQEGAPPTGGALPPGHPEVEGELPPGHPETEGELPPGHPPIGDDTPR